MDSLHKKGEIIRDRYQIVTLLGQGSTGDTYAAIDLEDSQQVAIKVVSFRQIRDWKILELFEREAKILANLDHPAIPKYLDYFHFDTSEDRRFYLIRELIEGDSLAIQITKGWHPDEKEVKDIAKEILDVLSYLHNLTPSVIHRDIKPENIIRRPDSKVFLVDFGGVQEVYRMTLSLSGTFVGTLGYMPPEQFRGQTQFASDLYGLGATLLYLLARCSPDSLPQKRMQIDFRSSVDISATFANWLEKMLEPAIEDRFQSANDALETMVRNRSVILRYEKPEYSHIFIERNMNYFIARIPQAHLTPLEVIVYIIFLLFIATTFSVSSISGILTFILLLNRGNIEYTFALFLVFGLVTIIFILFARSIRGDKMFIEINRKNFKIHRSFFLFTFIFKGETNKLKLLERSRRLNSLELLYDTPYSSPYEFGSWLKHAERNWLKAELSEFLDDISK